MALLFATIVPAQGYRDRIRTPLQDCMYDTGRLWIALEMMISIGERREALTEAQERLLNAQLDLLRACYSDPSEGALENKWVFDEVLRAERYWMGQFVRPDAYIGRELGPDKLDEHLSNVPKVIDECAALVLKHCDTKH